MMHTWHVSADPDCVSLMTQCSSVVVVAAAGRHPQCHCRPTRRP